MLCNLSTICNIIICMKNVDVPMWDKGDSTDSFNKGGASAPPFDFRSTGGIDPLVEEIFKLVLGREPSSRESSYYKYSSLGKEEIIEKLLNGDEHKEILEKAMKLPELKEENRVQKSAILKLRSVLDDKQSEFLELKRLLAEKNLALEKFREVNDVPYLSDKKIIEETNIHYSTSRESHMKNIPKENFWDRLFYLIGGKNEH